MPDAALIALPVALPILMAALAATLRGRPVLARHVGGIGTALTGAAAVALFLRATGGGTLPVTVFGGWPKPFAVSLVADALGTTLMLATAVIMTGVAVFAHAGVGARQRRAGYDALVLLLHAAVNGAVLTGDLFNLYVWFELALVAALGLLSIGRGAAAIDGAIRYAAISMLGASFILIGIALLYGATGTLDLAALGATIANRPPTLAISAAAGLFIAGFGLKAGLIPLHAWLVSSYHTAPVAVQAILAGLLTKVGFYALLRVLSGVFGWGTGGIAAAGLEPLLTVLALATMMLGVIGALAQSDMRRMFAWQVIGGVGTMMVGLALGTRAGLVGAVFYAAHSMLVQASLLMGAGVIHRASGSWAMDRVGGVMRAHPVFALMMAIPALSLAGIPPLSGFWAKVLLVRAGLTDGAILSVLALFVASFLIIVSVARFWSQAMWKDPPRGHHLRPVPFAMLLGMALPSAAILAIGLAPGDLHRLSQLSASALGAHVGGAP